MSTTPAPDNPTFRTLAPLAHCEGVAPGRTECCGQETRAAGSTASTRLTDRYEQVAEIDAWALGLCVDGDGLVYVCAYDRGTIVRVDPSNGETEVYAGDVGLPNWAVFAADGTLYVSDSGSEDPSVVAGRVLAIPPGGGRAEPLPLRPLAFANGMALATDGTFYVAESFGDLRVVAVRDGEAEASTPSSPARSQTASRSTTRAASSSRATSRTGYCGSRPAAGSRRSLARRLAGADPPDADERRVSSGPRQFEPCDRFTLRLVAVRDRHGRGAASRSTIRRSGSARRQPRRSRRRDRAPWEARFARR